MVNDQKCALTSLPAESYQVVDFNNEDRDVGEIGFMRCECLLMFRLLSVFDYDDDDDDDEDDEDDEDDIDNVCGHHPATASG